MSSAPAVTAKKAKVSKPKVPANHPPVIDMVKSAIVAAKDRKGTSLATIKKFIAANYKVDVEKLGPHVRRGIVHAVEKGVLVRVGNKGKGASGSFKVAEKKSIEHKPKPKALTKPKAPKPKKIATPKKPKAAVKKAAKPKTPKPKAVKKAVKPAAKKPKTHKKATPKKAAPKKK